MIRFIHLIRRKPELSKLEFRHLWNSHEFDELLVRAASMLGAVRGEKSLVLDISINKEMGEERGVEEEPYDALVEFWALDARGLEAALESEEYQQLSREMEALQAGFIDFRHSQRFFVDCNPPLLGEGADEAGP